MMNEKNTHKIGKSDLTKLVANKMNISQIKSHQFIDCFFDVLAETLQQKKGIIIPGLIKFSVKTRAKRMGHHPQTGKKITIPEKEIIQIKAGTKLSQSIKS
jgi:nucleoid DNA-binding protein